MKSWKEMNYKELCEEYQRVQELLKTNRNPFTQKQNKKYLAKIRIEIKQYESLIHYDTI